jgi:arginyl-tRNA synthetase
MGEGHKRLHLSYEFVKLPGGAMSSRTGQVVTYEELKNKLLEKAAAETKKRHQSWSKEKIKSTAWSLGEAAIKFEMNKVGAGQVITFDIDKALEFTGFTAAYLLYTGARISSIFAKAGISPASLPACQPASLQESEHKLILKLAKYPETVKAAGQIYEPSVIARYLFELAQLFNDYYHQVPVLKAGAEVKNARLSLLAAVRRVLENGMYLLGIKMVEEM